MMLNKLRLVHRVATAAAFRLMAARSEVLQPHLNGSNIALVRQPLTAGTCRKQYLSSTSDAPPQEAVKLIDPLVKADKCVVFMKGNPDAPRCGFSNAVVQILRMHGVKYSAYDVLESEDIRQGVKDYTQWPTIPQVFLNGEFIGGCDILLQMHKNGELVDELKKVGIA